MKILFTGGGTGGHFYPIIAVSEEIKKIIESEHLLEADMYFMAADPYDSNLLLEKGIKFRKSAAGKMRRYFSLLNILDSAKTFFGTIKAIWQVYSIFPDVVFSKGGYSSFPAVFAARLFGIPVIIHESDSKPGRVNEWAGKFAEKIALSYSSATKYFPEERVAVVGNPIRRDILIPQKNGAYEFLKLQKGIPVILVLGGSQGAQKINDAILKILPNALEKYQIIHQTGESNLAEVRQIASIVLKDNPNADRYLTFGYLNDLATKMSAGVAEIIISRAGSSIFEIAAWGIPSIIIPIPEEISHDQRTNAYTYARSGGAIVVEEKNLTPNLLMSEIDRLINNVTEMENMREGAKSFAVTDSAEKIAREIINIALLHEK